MSSFRSREPEKTEQADGEKFVWAPIKGPEGVSNNYIWAPISQEELFHEAKEKHAEKAKKGLQPAAAKKVTKSVSVESLSAVVVDTVVTAAAAAAEEQEVKFTNDEEEMRAYSGNSRVEATQQRMLNIKIRGLETTLDKVTFERSEVQQEKEQAEKELKVTEDQRRRLEATNRNYVAQLEKVRASSSLKVPWKRFSMLKNTCVQTRGELVEVRHHMGKAEEECTLLK